MADFVLRKPRLALRSKDAPSLKRTTSSVYVLGHASPICRIERLDARQLVWEGHAQWKNRCNDIELLRARCDVRGLSCQGRMQSSLIAEAYTVSELRMAAS